ncbi:MAG: serine--tRNA ligase [Pseudomonadota bacterium]
MLDIRYIRNNEDKVRWACEVKGINIDIAELLRLDSELLSSKQEVEQLQQQRNQLAKNFPKSGTPQEKQAHAAKGREIGDKIKSLEEGSAEADARYRELMLQMPNVPYDAAPIGPDDTGNVVIEQVGSVPKFDFEVRDHVELLELNDWADFPRAAKVSGSRSYLLKNDLAVLEQSLLLLATKRLSAQGFTPVNVPALVNEAALVGTGHFPGSREDIYHLTLDDMFLSGTAEVVINSLHAGELMKEEELPLLYVGFSPCFRREAGSAGKDVRGLLRVHQFNKIEQFVICKNDPEESWSWHDKLLAHARALVEDLELPYQVIEVCTGDMGAGKVRMHDIETWLPSQEKYRETHSCSSLHEWQSRRSNVRYKGADGKNLHVHTLNNTLVATPRIIAPLLECHQQADGSVRLPRILQPYFDGRTQIGGAG